MHQPSSPMNTPSPRRALPHKALTPPERPILNHAYHGTPPPNPKTLAPVHHHGTAPPNPNSVAPPWYKPSKA